jgi:hypothetical protein
LIQKLAGRLTLTDANRVLSAVERNLGLLGANINARLALEVVVLEFPNLEAG